VGAREQRPGSGGRRRANGDLEAEVLALLHASDRALTPSEVAQRLSTALAHTTVATTLARLHGRGVLTRDAIGRSYAYAPVTDESGLIAKRMHQVLADGPDRGSVLVRFVGELSEEDENLLRCLLGPDP
jgi:predicted transcriptional regulator